MLSRFPGFRVEDGVKYFVRVDPLHYYHDLDNPLSSDVLTVTPGIPGDSGSGFLNDKGQAFGVLSTLQFAPAAGSNGVGDLAKELEYMRTHASGLAGVSLVPGTEAFTPNLVGAILGS